MISWKGLLQRDKTEQLQVRLKYLDQTASLAEGRSGEQWTWNTNVNPGVQFSLYGIYDMVKVDVINVVVKYLSN